MLRTILSAIGSYAFIGILIFCTDQLYAHLIPGFSAMTTPPTWYFVASMTTDTIYTLAGGWFCSLISRRDPQATIWLIVLGELMGLGATVFLWKTVPHFYSFYLLLMYPPAVWRGANIRTVKLRAG